MSIPRGPGRMLTRNVLQADSRRAKSVSTTRRRSPRSLPTRVRRRPRNARSWSAAHKFQTPRPFRRPRCCGRLAASHRVGDAMSGEPAARTKVLVVDDSNLMRKAAQKMLSGEFDVVTAVDGIDAWAQIERDTAIQVVFSDLSMPRSDGYDLLRKVRTAEDTGTQGLPLIIVTGADNDEAARMKALDMGATDFITKPFTSTDLVARARAHAKYQRITKQLQEQTTLDPLTGMLNKAGFLDRLQQEVAFARRHLQTLTLVRVEIAGLRDLFLARGKPAAEALVLHVSKLLREKIRPEDSAGRVGLGGFALSFPASQHEGVEAMVGRLTAQAV